MQHKNSGKKVFAMKPEYRLAVKQLVVSELAAIGVEVHEDDVKPHLNGTVTIAGLTDSALAAMQELPGYFVFKAGVVNTQCVWGTLDDYYTTNSPVLTDAERAERARSSGSGAGSGLSQAEREKRNAALAERARRAKDLWGIDPDGESES